MSAFAGPEIVTNGLILALDAGNSKSYPGSGTAWTDLSGNKYDTTLTNGPTYSNGEFIFDGSNDHVPISSPSRLFAWAPAGTTGNRIITIETWIKTTDTSGYIFSKPWNDSGVYNIWLTHNSFLTRVDSAHSLSFTSIADGNWKQMVAIANETQSAVYVNGNIVAGFTNHSITSDTPSVAELTLPLNLMTLYSYGSGSWDQPTHAINGSMSIFKFYNRQLSATEIQQNFNALRGRFNV